MKTRFVFVAALTLDTALAQQSAKNVILFFGDGAGVSGGPER